MINGLAKALASEKNIYNKGAGLHCPQELVGMLLLIDWRRCMCAPTGQCVSKTI